MKLPGIKQSQLLDLLQEAFWLLPKQVLCALVHVYSCLVPSNSSSDADVF